MPTSATGRPTEGRPPCRPPRRPGRVRAGRGLTLIELLVVVAILAVLALPVALRFGSGGAFGGRAPAATAAERLTADWIAMRDRAVLARQTLGLWPRADGWDWLVRDATGSWQPLGPGPKFDALAHRWSLDGAPPPERAETTPPPVLLMPDGRGRPFELVIGTGSGAWLCRHTGWDVPRCAAG